MPVFKPIKSRASTQAPAKFSLRRRRSALGQHAPRDAVAEGELEPKSVATKAAVNTPPPHHLERLPRDTIVATWARLADSRSHLRAGLILIRERAKGEARKRRRTRRDSFHWFEREWGQRFWFQRSGLTPRALLTFALVLVVSLFVLLIASRAASRTDLPSASTSSRSTTVPIIIQHENYWDPPPPGAAEYALGVWVSDMSPPASGVEQVYVEVTRNPAGPTVEPVANVPVKLSSRNGVAHGVVKTTAAGLAVFTFFYGSVPGYPVYLTATATISGHTYSSTTDFVTG